MRHSLEFFRATGPVLRKPAAEDGAAIWKLIQACKPLDENSVYCNLIQCDHFRDTCVLAEENGKVVGWISAYVLPYDPQTVFVWQVAVAEEARGTGLGGKMLKHLLGRKELKDVTRLQTTITASNKASWALFKRFAQREGGELDNQAHFTRDTHFRGMAPTEHMVTISLPRRVKQAA